MATIDTNMSLIMIDPNEPLELYDGTIIKGRLEWFLYALCCLDYGNLPTPLSRIEEWANALITNELPNMEPQSRAEEFFKAILTGDTSNLPTPQSRSEVLLDKLARGENDFTNVEKIQSRYEFLLAYLIKNGGGIGNIDYILYEFSEKMKTMYNTVEKPFKSLELSGNTLVNCVLEDTKNDDYTSFDKDYSGTSFTINGTSEGAIKSAILTGQTLNSVIPLDFSGGRLDGEIVDGTWIKLTANGTPRYTFFPINKAPTLKPSTDYILFMEVRRNTISGGANSSQYTVFGSSGAIRNMDGTGSTVEFKTQTIRCRTSEDISSKSWSFDGYLHNSQTSGEVEFRMMFLEYQQGMENWDIPYFEGMQSVKMPVSTTSGKNLFNYKNYAGQNEGVVEIENGLRVSVWARSLPFINNLLPNTTYTSKSVMTVIEESVGAVDLGSGRIYLYNGTSYFQLFTTNGDKYTFTTPANIKSYDRILFYAHGGGGSSNGVIELTNIQLEQGTQATTYEPHKSNILSTPEEVVLRSLPNGVKDTLNLNTGEYVQRIGEVTFDGSNDEGWVVASQTNSTTKCFDISIAGASLNNGEHIATFCDKFPSYAASYLWSYEKEGVGNPSSRIRLRLNATRLSTVDVAGLRTYLQSNPFTVQYELATPIVKTVDLNVVDQNNTKIDKMHVFDEVTHVNTSSDELTPTVNIGKSVSYPTIIEPNTKYTVDLKRNDKPLTVNLGGTEVAFASGETRKTITTPSTLTNDKLSYYGVGAKCSEIMLIKGEVERNVDYFTGIQSVVIQNQMPILKSVGKNLLKYSMDNVYTNSSRSHYAPILNEDGSITLNSCYDEPYWLRKGFYVEKGKEYTVTVKGMKSGGYSALCFGFDNLSYLNGGLGKALIPANTSGNCIDTIDAYGTKKMTCTALETGYITRFYIHDSGLSSRYTILDFQVEEGSTATSYEPHKSSILSCNEEVTLRGIGDVKDTLDGNTGELTQRIGEIVLDGSENWNLGTNSNWNSDGDTFGFYFKFKKAKSDVSYSDKLPLNSGIPSIDSECFYINSKWSWLGVRLLKTKLTDSTVEGLKAYLRQNPITVQYQLTTESIKTVDLTITDQGGATIPKLKTFDKITHVNVSATDILPGVEMEVATTIGEDLSGSLYSTMEDIETKQEALKESNNAQTESVNSTMLATTEIYESLL